MGQNESKSESLDEQTPYSNQIQKILVDRVSKLDLNALMHNSDQTQYSNQRNIDEIRKSIDDQFNDLNHVMKDLNQRYQEHNQELEESFRISRKLKEEINREKY